MSISEELSQKHCASCEGGVPALRPEEVSQLLSGLPAWEKTSDSKRIRRQWIVKDFMAGMSFFDDVAKLAEDEGHHPDLHLVSYKQVIIELWTHSVRGLTENDFIMAAKIDKLAAKMS